MKKLNHILNSKWFYILLIFITFLYSCFYFYISNDIKTNHFQNKIIGIITDFKISDSLLTLEIKEKEKIIGYYTFKNIEEKEMFIMNYKLGDTILITGNISKPINNTVPNQFNYMKYLKYRGVYYQINIDSIVKQKDNTNLFFTIKNKLYTYINNFKSKDYLYAFLLGNKDLLNDKVQTAYQELGISHLLAISGMHISLLSGLILFMLKKIRFSTSISYIITIFFLILYMILLGGNPSVSRAVLLFSILCISKILQFNLKTIYVWIIVFSILIFKCPYNLFSIGFQFSFLISLFLILLQDSLKNKSYLKTLLLVSNISILVSIPITLYYFYQLNLFCLLLNLIFVPIISFIIYPLCLVTLLFPFVDNILRILLNIMESLVLFFNDFNSFKIILGRPNILWIILYYLFLMLFLLWKKKLFFILVLFLLLFQYFNLNIINKTFLIMIDVKQGDSLLFYSNGKTIMIDTGGNFNSIKDIKSLTNKTLIPLIKSLGIRKIDYLLLSHGDYDHMGEAINLVNNFKVENVIFNNDDYNDLENKLIKVLKKKNIKYYKGLKELNANNNKLYFLNTKEYDNENDNSNVLYFKLNNYKFLFMGDAGVNREKDILEKYNLENIDFIKIGHHGSNTSSNKYFMDNINPKNCLISVGKNNRYGHPNKTVLDTLNNYCNIYRTDLDGSIEIKLNKNSYKIKTYIP